MYQDFFNKNDDYLDEFRQKVANQKIATMEERRTELARSRNNFLGTLAGIVLAVVVGWFILAPQYGENSKEIPIIRRPQTAVQIKPENTGGMEIPNQDKDVYNIVEKKDVDNTVVENLLPTPEQPKLPDIAPEETDIDENATNLDEIVDEVSDKGTVTEAKSETIEQVPEKPADLLDESAEQKTPEPAKTIENKVEEPATGGKWQIQFLASKNKDAVEKSWNNLVAKHPELKAYNHEVQADNIGGNAIYKLRAGAFAGKEDAQKICSSLKAKGTDCIVKER